MFEDKYFKKAGDMTSRIQGFLTEREGELLFQLARSTRQGCIVEIGSYQGKSTVWIGLGTQSSANLKVYAIDPHTGSEEHQIPGQKIWTFKNFEENIRAAGLTDIVSPIIDLSHHARKSFDRPIGFLFIDGAHDYESVKKDYDLWAPLVVEGGIIAFHDTQQVGVRKVVDDVLVNDAFRKVFFQDTICYGVKTARRSCVDAFRARRMIGLKNRFFDICDGKMSKGAKKWTKELVKLKRSIFSLLK